MVKLVDKSRGSRLAWNLYIYRVTKQVSNCQKKKLAVYTAKLTFKLNLKLRCKSITAVGAEHTMVALKWVS